MTRARAPTGLLRVVIVLIGAHSLVLGLAVLTAPRDFTRLVGLPEAASTFFPSQSGAFLVALGLCYLLALRDRALVWTILVSKSIAVVFLLVHFLFLGAPPASWPPPRSMRRCWRRRWAHWSVRSGFAPDHPEGCRARRLRCGPDALAGAA